MIGYGMDGMDDEERRRAQEAINAVSPFYENKHPHLLYKDKDGNYVFMEMGRYTDPYGPITELGSAVLSGEPDRIGRAVSGLGALNPLLSNIGKGVPSVIKNDEEDLQAYEASGMNTPLKNYLANLTVISNPPILKNQLVNIAQGLGIIDDVESIELQEETQADRLVNSVAAPGVKMFTINPVESLGNMYTADFDRARTSMINDRIKGLRSVNEATISELYNDLRLEEQEIIGNHQKLVALARISGATNEQLSDSLKTGNLPRHQQRWLLNPVEANFRTNVLSEDQLNRARSDELKEVTDGEQRRAINLKYAELRRLRLELNKEFNADGT
jgi:hypothetical protein